jgi:beta-glucanase (GH16 family)
VRGIRLWLLMFVAALFLVHSSAAQSWSLVWSDEFNGPVGSAPDSTNWTYETGNNGGWGNNELEYYCPPGNSVSPCSASNPNIFLDGNGNLVIQAIKTSSGWTSGRMKTEGLQQFQYRRMEARMKLPVGNGLWPAFWMLGTNIGTVGWPTCGEQDIMEWVPQYTPTTTSSTIHGPGYSGANGIGSKFTFPPGGRVDDAGFHTYGVIWSQDQMQFYRDDYTSPFFTVTPANIPGGTTWVYNHPFFILLNLAVGGNFPKPGPDNTTPNPAVVLVDYVRVYEQTPTIALASSANPSVFGQPVTFTATLTPASATGTVQFQDGSTNLGGPVAVSGGTAASVPVSSLAVGAHSITAVYSGDSNFAGSTSSTLVQNVSKAASATAVGSDSNPSSFGQTVTFTATVSAVAPGAGTPTGTVQFKDGTNNLGSAATLIGGTATFGTSSLSVGTHNITAVYTGDANFTGSTSSSFAQTVNRDASSTSVSSSMNPSTSGQSVTFTAVVSAVMPGTPTGTVQFKDGVNNLGSPVTLSNGTAALPPTTSLTVGAHGITAVYSGDTIFAGSTSPVLTQSVTSTGTTATSTTISNIVVLPSPTPGQKPGTVHLEQNITVTATVATATGTPTGSVAILDNNNAQLGSSKELPGIGSTQNVTFDPVELGLGVHSIVVRYFGDSTFQTSSSSPPSVINHTPRPR